ncbi:MAG: HlyD family efflux transporter periplasmic adaptor subunit [Candidatus Pacebacteria bacterium]|nr:HlyD family efflux transporter periplasmic adaptor subunit [Candidatus Paceibacterota bacterium]
MLGSGTLALWKWSDRVYKILPFLHVSSEQTTTADQTYTVKRAPLEISVTEVGSLRAVKNHEITAPAVLQRVTVSWVIEENSQVSAGTRLIEFDRQPYLEQIDQHKSKIEDIENDIQMARDDLAYYQEINQREIGKAADQVELAKEALREYRSTQALNKRAELLDKITAAQSAYNKAKEALEAAQVAAPGSSFDNDQKSKSLQDKVEKAREQLEKAREQVNTAYNAYKEFKEKNYPEKLTEYREKVEKAEKDYKNAQRIAEADEEKYESKIRTGQETIKKFQERIADTESKLEHCIVTAPVDGVVLYGNPGQPGYSQYVRRQLKPGGQMHARPDIALMTIPDFSKFVVDVPVGEQYRGRLKPGADAAITIDAIPGETFNGKLNSISTVSRPRNPSVPASPKVYSAVVQMDGSDKRMVSGMTARVTLMADRLENVLTVPIEAVFNNEGETICYIQTPKGPAVQTVSTGKLNDDFVEITAGLKEGDKVWLYQPETPSKG